MDSQNISSTNEYTSWVRQQTYGNDSTPLDNRTTVLPMDHGNVVKTGTNYTAIIVEDNRLVEPILQEYGYNTIRLTHAEMITTPGNQIRQQFAHGQFSAIWITIPNRPPPSTKAHRHWQTITEWITKASVLQMAIHIMGPPTNIWKLPDFSVRVTECTGQASHATSMRS